VTPSENVRRANRRTLAAYYEALSAHFGPSGWWPGDTPFEVAVGAVLTQNTAWTNVEKAIRNLKVSRMLTPRAVIRAPLEELEAALKPSGYFRVKARRLRSFCQFLIERYNGDMERMAREPLASLRPELLEVHGIGPETADDILLYACGKPVFVVDAYTRRILARHELVPANINYEPLRHLFECHLPADVDLYKDYHAQLVYTGKDYCKTNPDCQNCPLRKYLPRTGPAPL
jgi:endonuclease III related protein